MRLDLDWRAVRAYLMVAECGGYTAAARRLGVTQSAVSHAIKRLEAQLECRLLTIRGKAPRLTPEGNQFFQQARRAVEQMERAVASASPDADGRGGLRVVFSSSTARVLLAPVLREYRDCYPDVTIDVGLEDASGAMEAVVQGRCDLALGIADALPTGVRALPLFRDQLQVAVAPGHPLAEEEAASLRDLARERFIAYRRESMTQRLIERHFLSAGVRPASVMEVPNFEVIKELVKLGLGVALIAPWVMAEEMVSGSLVAVPLRRPTIQRQWAILQQEGRKPRASERTFIGLCRMAVRQVEHLQPAKSD